MNLKKALSTLGLAAAIAGCGGAQQGRVTYDRNGVEYIVQHETGMSVPNYPWNRAQRQAVRLNDDNRMPEGFQMRGYLNEDGSQHRGEAGRAGYDVVMWTADTNGDRNPDLLRMIVNTQIVQAPDLRSVGRTFRVHVIIQDTNYDGRADRGWLDNATAEGDGYDSVFDLYERLTLPMQDFINNLVFFPRQR